MSNIKSTITSTIKKETIYCLENKDGIDGWTRGPIFLCNTVENDNEEWSGGTHGGPFEVRVQDGVLRMGQLPYNNCMSTEEAAKSFDTIFKENNVGLKVKCL